MDHNLRHEIIQAQRSRSDLLKWKLVLVAALGGAALGLERAVDETAQVLLLALIPFVCAYVDLLCTQIWLQVHVIGAYLFREGSSYEEFARKANKKAYVFSLEIWALYLSTILISVGVIILGWGLNPKYLYVVGSAAVVGAILSIAIWRWFVLCRRWLKGLTPKSSADSPS